MKTKPAAQQTIASGHRPNARASSAPVRLRIPQASAAPSTPVAPHAAICQGVHGPWPKKKFELSAGQGPDGEPRRSAERVAGDEHDVRGRLDVGDRGERDPAQRGECRQRSHQGDDPGVGPLSLIPGKAGGQGERQQTEGAELPAHAMTSRAADRWAMSAAPSAGVSAPPAPPRMRAVSVAK